MNINTFKNTTSEIKEAYGSPLNNRTVKRYAKLNPCPHDLDWKDRTILEVVSVDFSFTNNAIVRNGNGIEWVTPISHLRFCDKDGNRN